MPPKYINVDRMISEENEAFASAQLKLERGGKNITALINQVIHEKLHRLLTDAPAEDVVPVVHGKWLRAKYAVGTKCSNCGKFELDARPYCSYCGAKMDEDK